MRKTLKLLIVLTIPLLLSCSGVEVGSDFDKSAKFDKLQTYAWMPVSEENGDPRLKNTLLMSRIQTAIAKQLDLKGYKKVSESPDFLVAYHASVQEKTYYRPGAFYGRGPGFHRGEDLEGSFEEGTLIVDIVDSETQNLIWQGTAKKVVDWQADPETKTKRINDAVQKIFENFPP